MTNLWFFLIELLQIRNSVYSKSSMISREIYKLKALIIYGIIFYSFFISLSLNVLIPQYLWYFKFYTLVIYGTIFYDIFMCLSLNFLILQYLWYFKFYALVIYGTIFNISFISLSLNVLILQYLWCTGFKFYALVADSYTERGDPLSIHLLANFTRSVPRRCAISFMASLWSEEEPSVKPWKRSGDEREEKLRGLLFKGVWTVYLAVI